MFSFVTSQTLFVFLVECLKDHGSSRSGFDLDFFVSFTFP